MDIIQRNFLRLLRCGAFDQREPLEPMSAWKWERLYEVSRIHGVTPWITDGISRSEDDFFLQLSPSLRQKFDTDQTSRQETIEPQLLTNPLLNRKLQELSKDSAASTTESGKNTFELLQRLIAIARNILTQGISLRQLIQLGQFLRTHRYSIEYEVLNGWIKALNMDSVARLIGSLLKELFYFPDSEIKFTNPKADKSTRQAVRDIFQLTEQKAADWYFTQGESVFVRSNDTNAMMWHVKQSARYMRYYPSEAVTNFMRNLAHSLSHIEE